MTSDTRSVAQQSAAALLAEALAPLGARPCVRRSRWGHTRHWRVFWTRDDGPHHRRWIQPAFWTLTVRGAHLWWHTITAHGRQTAQFTWDAQWMAWDLVKGAESAEDWIATAQAGWAAWLQRVPPPVPSDVIQPWPWWARGGWAGLTLASIGLITVGLWYHIPGVFPGGILCGALSLGGVLERIATHRWLPSVWVPDSVPSTAAESLDAAAWALGDAERPYAKLWDDVQNALRLAPWDNALQLRRRGTEWVLAWQTNLPRRHAKLIPYVVICWDDSPYNVGLFYAQHGATYNAAHDTWEYDYHDRLHHNLYWSGTDWRSGTGETWQTAVWPDIVAHLTTWPWIHEPSAAERQAHRRYRRNRWIQSLAILGGTAGIGAWIGGPSAFHLLAHLGVHPLMPRSVDGAIIGFFIGAWLMITLSGAGRCNVG